MEPSPSSDPHEQRGPSPNKNVTIVLIMDCPTITVHAGKCYKALIDSRAAVSLVRYSTYQNIDNNLKTSIVNIDTPQYSGWITYDSIGYYYAPSLIADFKLSHNFNIEILFGINVQKKFALSCAWD